MTSPSTSWKEATDTTAGDATKFGAPDGLNKNNQLFNGDLNVDNVDINSPWFFRTSKCYFLNTAGTFGYLVDSSAAIAADRTVSFPLLTGNDTFVFQSHIQTISSKKIGNWLDSVEIAAPSSPAASEHRLYFDSTSFKLTTKNNAGTVEEYTTNSGTQTLTNKTLTTPTMTILDNALTVQDNADATKQMNLQLSSITTGNTRTITLADRNQDMDKVELKTYAIAASDETTVLGAASTSVPVATFHMDRAFTITGVKCGVTTAPTGASLLTMDIHEAGTTILSTKITIDASEKTSATAATAAVISDSSLAADSLIELFVDQLDTDNVATGLKFYIQGYYT